MNLLLAGEAPSNVCCVMVRRGRIGVFYSRKQPKYSARYVLSLRTTILASFERKDDGV